MLKGHVFKKQIFTSQIFALFINTFLNGKNGISNNYGNGMKATVSGNTVTVQSGVVCIQGRFLEEDTSTQISAGADTSYCKLVIEINLSAENTESEFNQASYKIVKSSSEYPSLTQNDIIKNNKGIYQYELARFKTTSSGIVDFKDMRTFLDFDSIYSAIQTEYREILEQLKQELEKAKDESTYVLRSDKVILYSSENGTKGTVSLSDSAVNYKYLEIFYKYGDISGSVKIDNPNGKKASLQIVFSIEENGVARCQYKNVWVETNRLLNMSYGYMAFSNLGVTDINVTENEIYITSVIGYKN